MVGEEDLVADFAVDTLVVLAVVLVKVEQSLGVGGVADGLAEHAPLTDDGIVLGSDLLHHLHDSR